MLILTEEEKIVILLSMLIQFFRPPIILDHSKVAASALHPAALTKHSNKLGNVFKKSTFLSYDARNMLTPGFDINAREKKQHTEKQGQCKCNFPTI